MPILALIPMPDHPEAKKKFESDRPDRDRLFPPEALVSSGGYTGDPKEITQNPAVTPQMLNEPSDLRDDLTPDDE